ncbi:SDR family oxidoreductase [Paenibacillus kobensis]|uniref:SDR family oxidoreductase n=1 Tax=Paenibacillus kobensis TaxID=59841 RepID=UPI000FD6BF61|nr:SDR family NAD(P)-dependent oxidoreductase [Paenibacillus kobensis]
MNKSGHTVLITGGAAGIGLALAKQFVRSGNQVIITGRDLGKLGNAKAYDSGISAYGCDLRSEAEVSVLVNRLYDEHPKLSVLVNNAGIQYNYSFLTGNAADDKKQDMQQAMHNRIAEETHVNFIAPVQLTAALLPLLARQDEAAVVNVSSGLGLTPKKSAPVYCATKAGIHLFTQALRYQLEQTNIRVFEIIPPIVDTEMTKGRGRGKITPDQLAEQFWTYYVLDRLEIPIGKVKLLRWLNRLAPSVAQAVLKNS